jgi:hypothetical protein
MVIEPNPVPLEVDKHQHNRRRSWLLAGVGAVVTIVIVGIVLFTVLLPMRGYAVSKEVRVRVLVADADTLQPLSNVPVVVFRSPEICYDDTEWLKHGVDPLLDDKCRQFVTGEAGSVEFPWSFHAIVGKNAFGTFGGVVSNAWVQISRPGCSKVVLPLDGQSAHRRDFHDENLIVVTVLLGKPKRN